ncbi:MAG: glycoside hydrolase family 97 protein [Saprospiraceae bacterium]|nr:glycoside hydrolase family 97 protein [Saprospiraceae bacterium]
MLKKILLLLISAVAVSFDLTAQAQSAFEVRSPDGDIRVQVKTDTALVYNILYKNKPLLKNAVAALTLSDGTTLGRNEIVRHAMRRTIRDTIFPVVREKTESIPDVFNELALHFSGNFRIIFRAYNDGVAYRFLTTFPDSITIVGETAHFRFPDNRLVYYPAVQPRTDADIFHTSFESPYSIARLDTLPAQHLAFSPVLLADTTAPYIAITESDLLNYPGMFLQKGGGGMLKGVFAPYPSKMRVTEGEFPQQIVTARNPWIARRPGTGAFPWRVLVVAPAAADLVRNDLVFRLASPNRLPETDWIKPGTSTEEWIIGSNIYDVPFEAGINTNTYKYYIDFAHRFGLEYVMLDAGWSDVKDLFRITPGMDMDSIANYARSKGVSLILWTLSMTLDRQLDSAMQQFQRWGVRCIMTDFMDRDDQQMVQFYERIAEATARYNIMVMFHGAYKPAGMQRTYPHLITREGALGSEFNIWSSLVTPEHDLLLPFIRQLSGPMDYEPGILDNATQQTFRSIGNKVMTQGTRAHQLAMFVVYESPLQMFSGNPSTGFREPEFMELLGSLPTTWDELLVLRAQFSDHLVLARRHGRDWYIAAMNDWTPFQTDISLDFLPPGRYRATICADGANAHRYPSDYTISEKMIGPKDILPIRLKPGGGWVARLTFE